MGDEESGDDDQWFERVTDADADESESAGTPADRNDQPIQSTDQWEWVQPDERQSDRADEPEDGERLWNHFGGEKEDTTAGEDASGTESTETETAGTASQQDLPENESSPSQSADTSGESHGAEVPPPPPTGRGQPEEGDAPPGPARRDIREMQPLYQRRATEFYLLWLAAALSYGLGDMVTTSVVFVTPRVGESNPIVALVLDQFGLVGLLAAKLVIFGFLLTISVKSAVDDDRLSYYGPPLLAILVGTGLTVWNLKTILGL